MLCETVKIWLKSVMFITLMLSRNPVKICSREDNLVIQARVTPAESMPCSQSLPHFCAWKCAPRGFASWFFQGPKWLICSSLIVLLVFSWRRGQQSLVIRDLLQSPFLRGFMSPKRNRSVLSCLLCKHEFLFQAVWKCLKEKKYPFTISSRS